MDEVSVVKGEPSPGLKFVEDEGRMIFDRDLVGRWMSKRIGSA